MQQSALINVMTKAVRKASERLLRDFGEVGHLKVTRKGTNDFVTAADVRTERVLQDELSHARPKVGFLMEEKGEIEGVDKNLRWVIDPVDGTNNFIHAIPYFCISVALEKMLPGGGSEILAGVVYDPVHDELFTAEKGNGAFLNHHRLQVSDRRTVEESFLVTSSLHEERPEYEKARALLNAVSRKQAVVRMAGATALDLAYIAAGRYDGGWYTHFEHWDVAAGMLLVSEAGGEVETLGDGESLTGKTLVTANTHLNARLKQILRS